MAVAEETRLIKLDAAKRALAEAKTLPDVKELRDRAAALLHYAKQQQVAVEILNDAAEMKLRTERKAGKLLREMEEAGQRQSGRGDHKAESHRVIPQLKDLGVTPKQSSRWQREAALPDDAFESYVAETRAKGEELTTAAVLRQATPFVGKNGNARQEKQPDVQADIVALWDHFERLSPHWHTQEDRLAVCAALRSMVSALS